MVTLKRLLGTQKGVKAACAGGLLLLSAAPSGHAATQGDLGYSSSASISLSLTIRPLIRVSGIQDIQLSAVQGESVEGTTPVCVGGTSGGEYSIEAHGSGGGSEFLLNSGDDTIPYIVTYDDAGGMVDIEPADGTVNRPLDSSLDCGDGANAKLTVAVDGEQTGAAPAGVYNGTLTLVVSPQ